MSWTLIKKSHRQAIDSLDSGPFSATIGNTRVSTLVLATASTTQIKSSKDEFRLVRGLILCIGAETKQSKVIETTETRASDDNLESIFWPW